MWLEQKEQFALTGIHLQTEVIPSISEDRADPMTSWVGVEHS